MKEVERYHPWQIDPRKKFSVELLDDGEVFVCQGSLSTTFLLLQIQDERYDSPLLKAIRKKHPEFLI